MQALGYALRQSYHGDRFAFDVPGIEKDEITGLGFGIEDEHRHVAVVLAA